MKNARTRQAAPLISKTPWYFTFQPGHFCQGHAPVIDGPGGFIPDYPYRLREEEEFAQDVQIMSGYNSEDGSLYTVFSMLHVKYVVWHVTLAFFTYLIYQNFTINKVFSIS